jgi:hypothetical protein
MPASPVFFDPSVETIAEDETETLEQLSATFLRISDVVFAASRHAFRSVHAKSHGIMKANWRFFRILRPSWPKVSLRRIQYIP